MSAFILPILSIVINVDSDRYFTLAVLGEDRLAGQYFSSDSTTSLNESINWNIIVKNNMGRTQLVSLRFKFLNETLSSPEMISCKPSIVPEFFELKMVIPKEENITIPISWSIKEIEIDDDNMIIKKLLIDDNLIDINIKSLYGFNYKIIVELWFFEEKTNSFVFGWTNKGEINCAWSQIWFNVTFSDNGEMI
jgi:hypothetical protein